MKLPARGMTVVLVRAIAIADLALAFVGARALLEEMRTHGFADSLAEVGPSTTFVAVTGLVIAPSLTAAWLGFGLWRLDRVAWVGQIAAGVTVPIVGGLFFAVGLADGPMGPILGGLGAFFAVSLLLLARRPARWSFGIGPDAVLAEIHTRGEVSVAELARRFAVRPPVIETLLAQTTARGVFLGGWDRSNGRVYSVATLLSREALRRCPRCGGAVESVAHVARCPYCATEFAELRGLEHPIPSPIGVELLGALDRVFAYVATFLAITWVATFLEARIRPAGEDAKLWWLFGGVPVACALIAVAIGRRLQGGRRSGWIGQQLTFPFAIPYLRRRPVRALFASGLAPVRERLARDGEVPFDTLARELKVAPRHVEELAVHLTATRTLDSVIDWQSERLVARDALETDGRERCRSCGAPLRLGGSCAFCGTSKVRAGEAPAPPKLPSAGWGLANLVTRGAAVLIPLVALAVRPTSTTASGTSTTRPTPRPPTSETPLDLAFTPVEADYDPTRREIAFAPQGVGALAYDARGRLFSGESNGLFVWEGTRRSRRTPPGDARVAGVRWIDFDPNGERFFVLPYHSSIIRGRTDALRVDSRLDFNRLQREIQSRDGHAHPPSVVATARDSSGRLLALFAGRGLHLRDLTTGASLLEIPAEVIAGEENLELSDATMARDGSFVAFFAWERDGPGGLFATRRQRFQVWDVATRTRRLQWSPEASSTDAVLTHTRRGSVRFAPDPRFVVTLLAQELRYWDVERGRAVRTAGLANGRLSGPIAFSADGRRLALVHHPSSGEASVGVMAFELGDSLRPLDSQTPSGLRGGWHVVTHAVEVSALAFDPSGEVLVSGDVGGAVRFTPLVALPRPDEP